MFGGGRWGRAFLIIRSHPRDAVLLKGGIWSELAVSVTNSVPQLPITFEVGYTSLLLSLSIAPLGLCLSLCVFLTFSTLREV